MSEESSLLGELKRRNVLRVATAYAIASWVLLQLGDIVIPALDVPESSIRYLIIALLVGFPVVIGFSWFYEVTPEGLKPTRQIRANESIAGRTGRRIDFVIIGLLSVALLFFMNEYFAGEDVADAVVPETVIEQEDEAPAVDTRPSIAVLPLMNMSSDVENEHFSDGLTEELLNVLAQNQSLRVAGRTSSFFYKGKNENLQEIGQALGVEHLLEGSVRKSGEQVRITVQLIDTDDGFHIWSQTYDRKLTDIFAVQDEIARAVAGVMEVTLLEGGGDLPESRLTENTAAYEMFLEAKELLYQRNQDSVLQSIDLFQQVTQMDPGFAPPFVSLAEAYLVAQNNHASFELAEAAERANAALDAAVALGFETAEYWATRGLLHHHLTDIDRENFDLAAEAYEEALGRNENLVNAYIWYSTLLSEESEGVPEVGTESLNAQSLRLTETAIRLDPLNRVANLNYQIELTAAGRWDEAEANLKRLYRLDPEYPSYPEVLARLYLQTGRFAESASVVSQMDAVDGRAAWVILDLLEAIEEEAAAIWWIDTLDGEGPMQERLKRWAWARQATLPEVIAEAQLALLAPDIEHRSGSLSSRLMQEGEYQLARRLIENMHPDFAGETARFSVTDGHIFPYIIATYQLGEVDRAREIARLKLEQNRHLPRLGFRGRGPSNALLYSVLGRREEAIIEYRATWSDGYRLFNLIPLSGSLFADVEDDPRIVDLMAKMDAYVAEHRPAVLGTLADAGILAGYPGLESPNEI